MKILHVQRVAGLGGSERHLLTLLPALTSAGLEVSVSFFATGEVHEARAAFRDADVDVRWHRAGADVSPGMVRAIARDIERSSPDVVHTHLVHADLHGRVAARWAGVPVVSSAHSVHAFFGREPIRSAYRVTARWVPATIAISHHVARYLQQHRIARPDSVHVVPYGIEVDAWATEAGGASLRRSLGIGADRSVVGIASRLISGKGHDQLLEAIASMRPGARETVVLIAGDGPLRSALEARARSLSVEARFFGFVADMPEFMQACDVVAFPTQPSLGEGFGLAALEAMAAGRPVVATEVASIPEIVEHGVTGTLVAPGDPAALGDAIAMLLDDADLRSEMGRAGRRRVSSTFSIAAMLDGTTAVYEGVV